MIKHFVNTEINAVMELWIEAMSVNHSTEIMRRYQPMMKEFMETDVLYVYEIEGAIIGFIAIDPQMTLRFIAVTLQHRGMGVGEALVDHCVRHYKQVSVILDKSQLKLTEFFARCGFVLVGQNSGNTIMQSPQNTYRN